MITCVADDCKHNQNCKCILEDITLNLDLKCTKFRLKKKNCKRCGLEFQPKNNRSEYCSIKCRNHFNVNIHRGKPGDSTHNTVSKPLKLPEGGFEELAVSGKKPDTVKFKSKMVQPLMKGGK
jgi:hypothetical protein